MLEDIRIIDHGARNQRVDSPSGPLSVALWAMNVATPVASLEEWLGMVDVQIEMAKAHGSDLLVMPEYSCIGWLHFRPAVISPKEEVAWLGDLAIRALPALESMVRTSGVSLLAGTFPHQRGLTDWTNRAHLMLSSAPHRQVRRAWQDKLFLTPEETDPREWMMAPGREVHIINWEGWRIVILICHDNTVDALTQMLMGTGIDMILAPTMTDLADGKVNTHEHIFRCIQRNAANLNAYACAAGAVGTVDLPEGPERNIGGGAFYDRKGNLLGSMSKMAECSAADGKMLITGHIWGDEAQVIRNIPFKII